MEVFTRFFCLPNYHDGHFVQWEVNPLFKDQLPYCFTLQISELETFSEVRAEIRAGDTFWVVDNTGIKKNWSENYFYRLKFETGSGQVYYSRVIAIGAELIHRGKYRKAMEIMRIELISLRPMYAGEDFALLKRKTYGVIADIYVDPVSGVPLTNSTSEFGTGVVGGYFDPVPFRARSVQQQTSKELAQDGNALKQVIQRTYRKIGYPIVSEYDVVVDVESDKRYTVKSVQDTLYPATNITMSQIMNINLIPQTDSVYSIYIPKTAPAKP